MTTKDFFDGFSDYLSEDDITKPYTKSFIQTLMDQSSADYQNKIFTRTGYRCALIFFDQYGKNHPEFISPECFKAKIEWKDKNIENIKKKLATEYDTVMYIGKENCEEDCNFVIFDPNIVTAIELMGNVEAFLDSLER